MFFSNCSLGARAGPARGGGSASFSFTNRVAKLREKCLAPCVHVDTQPERPRALAAACAFLMSHCPSALASRITRARRPLAHRPPPGLSRAAPASEAPLWCAPIGAVRASVRTERRRLANLARSQLASGRPAAPPPPTCEPRERQARRGISSRLSQSFARSPARSLTLIARALQRPSARS